MGTNEQPSMVRRLRTVRRRHRPRVLGAARQENRRDCRSSRGATVMHKNTRQRLRRVRCSGATVTGHPAQARLASYGYSVDRSYSTFRPCMSTRSRTWHIQPQPASQPPQYQPSTYHHYHHRIDKCYANKGADMAETTETTTTTFNTLGVLGSGIGGGCFGSRRPTTAPTVKA